jgi:hypothetical protein
VIAESPSKAGSDRKTIPCYLCRRQVVWGKETVYGENGTLICLACFEKEAAEKGIIVRDGRIFSNHQAPSPQQGKCVSCLRCCREIGCCLLDPEQGCLIYTERPQACRDFFCKELTESNPHCL